MTIHRHAEYWGLEQLFQGGEAMDEERSSSEKTAFEKGYKAGKEARLMDEYAHFIAIDLFHCCAKEEEAWDAGWHRGVADKHKKTL